MQTKIRINREPILFGDQTFLPINVDAVRVDSVPDFDLYFRPGAGRHFVLYCEHNITFTAEARKRLIVQHIEELFIRQEDALHYHRYLAQNLSDILNDSQLTPREKSSILYDSAQAVARR